MKQILLGLCLLVGLIANAQTVVEKSDTIFVNETWSADSVKVTGNIVVTDSAEITIEPGTIVEFQGQFYFRINGKLTAKGTPDERIYFTANNQVLTDSTGGWFGINLQCRDTNITSVIMNCNIEYVNRNSLNSGSRPLNLGYTTVSVVNNYIQNNELDRYSSIISCGGKAAIIGNVISNNEGEALVIYSGSPLIYNNTIVNNSKGIDFYGSTPIINNNIIFNNSNNNISATIAVPKEFKNNMVPDYTGEQGHLSSNPLFDSIPDAFYSLSSSSPGLNSGINDTIFDTYDKDISGNPRVYNNVVDRGAYEYQGVPDPFLELTSIAKQFVEVGKSIGIPVMSYGYPEKVDYKIAEAPLGLTITNDTIRWDAKSTDAGQTYSVLIEVTRGAISKKLNFEIYGLNKNEVYNLPDSNVVWESDTIKVMNNLQVADGQTLEIKPGVVVEFMGRYLIDVKGSVVANATKDKRIWFIASDTATSNYYWGWKGFWINSPLEKNGESIFNYCNISHVNTNNYEDQHAAAIRVESCDKVKIYNCKISDCNIDVNSGVVNISRSTCSVINNIITNCSYRGIVLYSADNSIVANNTIINNKLGIHHWATRELTIENNILHNEGMEYYDDPNINTFDNIEYFRNNNLIGSSNTENGNIDADPKFIDADNNQFELMPGSPCINSGNSGNSYQTLAYKYDFAGNPRICMNDGFQLIDMGAYEYTPNNEAYIHVEPIELNEIREGKAFSLPLTIVCNQNYQVTIKTAPADNFSIINDTLKWIPEIGLGGKTYDIELLVTANAVTKIIPVSIKVIKDNVFDKLPDENILWYADTIFVFDNLTVPFGKTLTINPGVVVEFQGNYNIKVNGNLIANGTALDNIIFTAKDTSDFSEGSGWGGIDFEYSDNVPSSITYCVFTKGSPFTNNYNGFINLEHCQNILVANNKFINNFNYNTSAGTVLKIAYSNAKVVGNLIANNYGDAFYIYEGSPIILNNTIVKNNGGIRLTSCLPTVINNAICNNNQNVSLYQMEGGIYLGNNIGMDALSGKHRIIFDPLFVNDSTNSFELSDSSLCINSGVSHELIDSLLPTNDLNGNPRIFDGVSKKVDIGAFEYQGEPKAFIFCDFSPMQYTYPDSSFNYSLPVYSYPKDLIVKFLSDSNRFSVKDGVLSFMPIVDDACKTFSIILEIDNGLLKDTLNAQVHVLGENEFINLPDTNVTWNHDTVRIFSSLIVKEERMLIVNPGVRVEFQGHYSIKVKGTLLANGEPNNRIQFTASNTHLTDSTGGWAGIEFDIMSGREKASSLTYGTFTYTNNSETVECLSDSLFIGYNLFHNNRSGGRLIRVSYRSPHFVGNVIADNDCEAVGLYNSSSLFVNNTIVNNLGGIFINTQDSTIPKVRIVNSIIQNNSKPYYGMFNVYAYQEYAYPELIANNIGGLLHFENGNIDEESMFFEDGQHPYQLHAFSPGVNQGSNSWVGDTIEVAFDNLGNARIFDGDSQSIVDIGAYECSTTEIPKGINTFPGKARTEAVSFVIGDNAYVGMGNNGTDEFADFYKFSYETQSWSAIAAYRGGYRESPMVFTDGEKAYVGLGRIWNNIDSTYYYFEDTEVYDPLTNEWSVMPDNVHSGRINPQSFNIDGNIYAGGGYDGNKVLRDLWMLDKETSTWEQRSSFPSNVEYWRTSVVIDDKVYLFVSGENEFGGWREFIYEYDVNEDTYEKIRTNRWFWNPVNGMAIDDKALLFNVWGQAQAFMPALDSVHPLSQKLDSWYDFVSFKLRDSIYYGLGSKDMYPEANDPKTRKMASFYTEPLGINIDKNSITTKSEIGALIGELSVDYFNPWNEHTIVMTKTIAGQDTLDNEKYYMEDNLLYLNYVPNSEALIDSILVTATSNINLAITKKFYVYIEDKTGNQLFEVSENSFNIYPNPAESMITIEAINDELISELQMFNIAGTQVLEKQINQLNLHQLDVSIYESGVYYLMIKTESKQYMQKVIIE